MNETDRDLLHFNHCTNTPKTAITIQRDITKDQFVRDFRQPCATQHRKYTGKLATLLGHISSAANTTAVPEYNDIDAMTVTLQHLHMSEILHQDEEAVDPDGPNDIDVSPMLTGGGNNNDFTIGGYPEIQLRIRDILHDFRDIFSYNVKGQPMAVPP